MKFLRERCRGERWIAISRRQSGSHRDAKKPTRQQGALKLRTTAASIRIVLLLVLVLGALAALCVFAVINRKQLTSKSRAPSLSDNEPAKTSSSATSSPVSQPPNAGPVSNLPHQGNTATYLPEDDAPNIPVVTDRPYFASAGSSVQRKAAARADLQLQKAASSLRDYRQAFAQNPIGTNAEITSKLLGKNPRGARYLPATAKVNDKGEMTDRWDRPLFFHQISGSVMEIRSAGPDHVMWTNDDEFLR